MNPKYYDYLRHIPAIKRGDILDVSSDILLIGKKCLQQNEEFDPDKLIDSIQDKVGSEGTILIRVWNWDFCQGVPFDVKNTPSRVGALGNIALTREDFKRTAHPLYSFAVWGAHQELLCNMQNISAWGGDSPFAFLTINGGKQLMLGSTMWNSLTYVHYVEEQVGVPYRYLKDFTGTYIDEAGRETIRTYQMNVRDLNEDVIMTSENFAPIFLQKQILYQRDFDGIPIAVVNLPKAYSVIEKDIRKNRSRTFCRYNSQEKVAD